MTEDEIIERANHFVNIHVLYGKTYAMAIDDLTKYQQVFKGLLDLYQREKDSNQWLLKAFDESRNNNIELAKEHYKLQEELQQEKEKTEELLKDREKSTQEYIHNNPWLYKQLAESYILKSDIKKDYISKDRIREKIDFLENGFETSNEDINYKLRIEDKAQKQVLKELLEEE